MAAAVPEAADVAGRVAQWVLRDRQGTGDGFLRIDFEPRIDFW